MGLKRVIVKYSTNFWSFLTKCTTFLGFLTLKNKNENKMVKKKTCAAFNPKKRKWALNELWWYIRQTFCVFWPKLPLSWDSWHQNKRTRLKSSKKKLVPLLTLKRANGLKTSYGEIFDKLLVFFDQMYHFPGIHDTKKQKRE